MYTETFSSKTENLHFNVFQIIQMQIIFNLSIYLHTSTFWSNPNYVFEVK